MKTPAGSRPCRVCGRAIYDVVDSENSRQVLDAVAPVFRLTGPDSAVRELGVFVSHWSSCYAGAVQKRLQEGVRIPESWKDLAEELREQMGDDDPFVQDHRAVETIASYLENLFGSRPPGSYSPTRSSGYKESSSSSRSCGKAENPQRSLLDSET